MEAFAALKQNSMMKTSSWMFSFARDGNFAEMTREWYKMLPIPVYSFLDPILSPGYWSRAKTFFLLRC